MERKELKTILLMKMQGTANKEGQGMALEEGIITLIFNKMEVVDLEEVVTLMIYFLISSVVVEEVDLDKEENQKESLKENQKEKEVNVLHSILEKIKMNSKKAILQQKI